MAPHKTSRKSKEPSSTRSRSFGGCATCRMRHMKCDEGKPTCLMCKHFGTECGGYEKNIFFASEEDDGVERFRRPLFTEEEREQMSIHLISSIPQRFSLLNVLSQIDEECEHMTADSSAVQLSVRRGPFGVFKLAQDIMSDLGSLNLDLDPLLLPIDQPETCFSPSALTFSPRTQEVFDTFIDGSEPLFDTMLPADLSMGLDEPRFDEFFGESASSTGSAHTVSPPKSLVADVESVVEVEETSTASSPISVGSSDAVPESAVHLLKHYSTTVISLLTPSRNTKTLWHVLFLPHVKSSLAALSMGEKLDHASLSSFFGTLAISAFHLGAVSKSQMWYDEGCKYKQKSRHHIRLALRAAYNIPKIAKYKSILVSLLTMVQLSMFNGDWKQTECYLLEAEKFIRLRGLQRPKSRKRRLLHHCYAFMRILHESLFTMTTSSLQRIHVRRAVENSCLMVVGSDSPYFKLSSWKSLVQKMLEVKSPEEGENDLHLENPGLFSATMYPEIYGLPEEWLLMLSQVIRLGNEKDPQREGATPLSLKEFTARAKDLEQCIVNWHQPPVETFCGDLHATNVDDKVLQPLLDALHQALIIYFYRRIYDVDCSMLQTRVQKVCECLEKCDEADPSRVRYTSVFIWPAFIAACEADDHKVQGLFTLWFEDCIAQSGQSSFEHMFSIVRQVWCERHQSEGSSVSWLDFMKNTNVIQ